MPAGDVCKRTTASACCRSTRSGRTHRAQCQAGQLACVNPFCRVAHCNLRRVRRMRARMSAGARPCIPHMATVCAAPRAPSLPVAGQATGLLGWRCVPFGSPSAAPCCPSKGQPVGGLSTASRRQWSLLHRRAALRDVSVPRSISGAPLETNRLLIAPRGSSLGACELPTSIRHTSQPR